MAVISDGQAQVTILMPQWLKDGLEAQAEADMITQAALIRLALKEYIAKRRRDGMALPQADGHS